MSTIIVNYASREKRFAVVKDARVESIVIDRPENRSLVGNIFYGTVTKVLPGMNAVFVDIGEGKNAYMHRDTLASYVRSSKGSDQSITSFVHQGEKVLVQVEKDATGTKGPRVTGIVEIQGSNLIYLPNGRYVAVSKKIGSETKREELRRLGRELTREDEGLIFRTSSIASGREEMLAELSGLRLQYQELASKAAGLKKPGLIFKKDSFIELIANAASKLKIQEVVVDDLPLKYRLEELLDGVTVTYFQGKENVFSAHRVEHELEKALKRVVWLENGAYLVFDETEALTIIDVNTGKFSGKHDYQETVFKTNQLAAREIVRQLRLRDIGGIVLIDFIDMKREQDRISITEEIEKELAKDDKRTKLIGFTPLGILQLTRKKTKVTLSEALQVKCPVCEGTGRVLSPDTIAFRLERELLEHRLSDYEAVLVETTKEVKETFSGAKGEYLDVIEESLHMKIYFSVVPSPDHYYRLKQFGTVREITQKAGEFY